MPPDGVAVSVTALPEQIAVPDDARLTASVQFWP